MLFKFKYPKLTLLIITIILAYFIFKNPSTSNFISGLGNLSYLGVFIAGIFFSFGFTTPFAVGFFITLKPENLVLSGVIGGFGAMMGDLFIFNLIRFSFMDEFYKLKKVRVINGAEKFIEHELGRKITHYLLFALSGIIIASPLPDEIGVSLLAGLTHIKQKILAIVSFVLNTIGIIILLSI